MQNCGKSGDSLKQQQNKNTKVEFLSLSAKCFCKDRWGCVPLFLVTRGATCVWMILNHTESTPSEPIMQISSDMFAGKNKEILNSQWATNIKAWKMFPFGLPYLAP